MTLYDFSDFVTRYVAYIIPIPLLIGIQNRRYLIKELRITFFFICNSVFFEVISKTMAYNKIPNLYLFHLYVLMEFLFISWFYYELFKKYISPKIIPVIYIFFVSFSLIDTFIWHNPFTFNSYAKTLECMIIVSYTVFYLHKTFDEFQDEDPSDTPVFWINAGFLFYFSGCLFLFTFSNFILTQGKPMGIVVWAVHAFFIIIMYSLISVGLWKSKKNTTV
jgi:hypothetical protein